MTYFNSNLNVFKKKLYELLSLMYNICRKPDITYRQYEESASECCYEQKI